MNNQPFLNDQNFFKSTSLKNGQLVKGMKCSHEEHMKCDDCSPEEAGKNKFRAKVKENAKKKLENGEADQWKDATQSAQEEEAEKIK